MSGTRSPWCRLVELTSHQQQTQRTLRDWLRMEYGIANPSNKLLAPTQLDSNTWVSEVKRIRGKKQPLTAAGLHALREEYTRTLEPARALTAETLTLERKLKAEGQRLNAESLPLPRPDPAGDCPDVANRPVTDAHPPGPQPAWNDMPAQDETV